MDALFTNKEFKNPLFSLIDQKWVSSRKLLNSLIESMIMRADLEDSYAKTLLLVQAKFPKELIDLK